MRKLQFDAGGREIEFFVIENEHEAWELVAAIEDDGDPHALDFETTALRAKDGYIRLTSICGPVGNYVIDHALAGPFEIFASALAHACPWYVFNAGFEGRWFDHYTEDPYVELRDVGLMHKAKFGGGPLDLARLVKIVLQKERDKTLQTSDWGADTLTDEQYFYGFEDAWDTYEIAKHYRDTLTDGQIDGFFVMNSAWRGTAEMEDTGVVIDVPYLKKLIRMWELRRDAAIRVLRQYTPEETISNLNSKKQLSDFIKSVLDEKSSRAWPQTAKSGQLSLTRSDLRQASFRAPYPFSRWLAALMVYNRASKYLSTYGETLITKQELSHTGRIYARFNIAQAVTCRYSSSGPNLQNIPRSPLVRRAFIAPDGAIKVLADYSGIELRVLAEVSGDAQLKHDVIYGNVHAESAITIYQLEKQRAAFFEALDDDSHPRHGAVKEQRSKAKAFSFQLTYGAGFGALAVVLRCSDEQAAEFVRRWAQRYPDAYNYRHIMAGQMNATGFLPVKSGRTIYVHRNDRSVPVASNYPIQGAAADVMYRAIARMSEAVWNIDWPVSLQLTVHDELGLLCRPEDEDKTKKLLEDVMKAAWLDIFPGTSTDNLVEAAAGTSWAVK